MAERVVTAHIYLYLTVRQEQTRCGSRGVREIFPSFTTPGLFLRGRSDLSVIYRDTTRWVESRASNRPNAFAVSMTKCATFCDRARAGTRESRSRNGGS